MQNKRSWKSTRYKPYFIKQPLSLWEGFHSGKSPWILRDCPIAHIYVSTFNGCTEKGKDATQKMIIDYMEDTVVVRPSNGMQLAEGFIRKDYDMCFIGQVPGLVTRTGESKEDVRFQLEQVAKKYYGADVIVEIDSA